MESPIDTGHSESIRPDRPPSGGSTWEKFLKAFLAAHEVGLKSAELECLTPTAAADTSIPNLRPDPAANCDRLAT